jgi:acetyl esterase/lipase
MASNMKLIRSSIIALLALFVATTALGQTQAEFTRTEDVIYGRKHGVALTMDILQPAKPNGYGVIFVISGGWYSAKRAIRPKAYSVFLERGYTICAVVHGSQPKFQIPEIEKDIRRATRFIRHNAKSYGVDPGKLGVTGGSAGGHLSLLLAARGEAGDADAKDPVERES